MFASLPPLARVPLLALLAVSAAALATLAILVPLDERSQWLFALALIAGALLVGRSKSRKATLAIAALSLLVSTRYIVWRTTNTLEFDTFPAFLLGTGLYLAELYSWVILALGFLQTSWPLERPVKQIAGPPEQWPSIDVFIPTYNESIEIVQNTVFAAMDMDYPPDRFKVFILDDGRRPEFQAFARVAGCGYLTRPDNLHAKAGNLNAAMKKTEGELIAIFDCDHVPTRAFLQLSVGWFQTDPRLALMQTPHHFYSPDPIQRNLTVGKDMPGEGDLFYGSVQKGNDLWNAAFFCGSCALIRRTSLEETDGFAGETVTEDAHTALKLQRKGWNTAYIGARLSAGLATERLVLHIGQRIRWARGMTQIFRIDNPLFGPGLKWQQRLCYLNAMLHFQFPLPRIVFLTAPLSYLIFGQNIIHASASLIFAYALPHLFVSMQSSERIQGGDRRPFWGEIYETLLAFHLVKPTVFTLLQPRKGKFNVTDKGGILDRTYFDFATVKPHLIAIALLVFGIAFGVAKYAFFPELFNIQGDTLLLNAGWAAFSLVILVAAVSVAREQRQVRQHIRIHGEMPVTIYFEDGHVVEGNSHDISMGGLAVRIPEGILLQGRTVTDVALPMGDDTLTIPVDTVRMDKGLAQVRFQPLDRARERLLVRAVMGRADAWEGTKVRTTVSGTRSIRDILSVDLATFRAIARAPRTRRVRRRLAQAGVAGLAVGALLAIPQGPATAQPAVPEAAAGQASPGTNRQRLSFKDLRVTSPIRLQGTRGEIAIPFGLRADQVVTGSSLTLNFSHSPALLGDLSQLVVLLNGEVVRAVQLGRDNAGGQILTVPVNPALFLPGTNQLNLRFLGHYARDCEDPFHSSLWANVSNVRSFFDLQLQTLPIAPDLARLPQPFFDKHQSARLNLPFVFAGAPTNAELEASASLASWFGGMASFRGFSFKPSYGQLPRGNAVVFLSPARPVAGLAPAIDGASVAVMKNPVDPFGELLLVMGRNDRELKLAAAGLASGKGVFGGARMALDGVRIPTYPRYGAPRWLRTDRPVRLGEIVDPYALQGIGLPPGPLTTAFRGSPDLFFWPRQGATLNLAYRYPRAPWLDRNASRLDLSMNGQFLQAVPLAGGWLASLRGDGTTSSHTGETSVVLPRYNMFGQNELVFDYNLMLAGKKRCSGTLPENVRTSILPESTIDLTHAYHALRMPDLATFANAGYPFTIRPDLAETAVVMAAQPSPATVEAFLQLMGRFGDATGAPATGLTVVRNADPDVLEDKDVLVLGGVELARLGSLFAGAPVRYDEGRLSVAQRSPLQRVFDGGSPFERVPEKAGRLLVDTREFAGIVSFQSPLDKERSVIALLASEPLSLPLMIEGLAETKINAQVQGDLSVVDGDGMASFAVGSRYWVGDLPGWMRLAYWFSRHPLLLALSAIAVALLVSVPAYALLKRQERKRLAALEKHDG